MAGAEHSLLVMARSLSSRFEPAVACPVPSPLSRALAEETIQSFCLPDPPDGSYSSPRSCGYWAQAARRLTTIARHLCPDLIHANSLCAGLAALPAVAAVKTRLVVHARDLTRHRWAARLCGRFCRRMIAVSSSVRDSCVHAGVDAVKIRVVYNAVDRVPSNMGEETECSVRTPPCQPRCVFANVGQFVPWKNQLLFLDAASRVAELLPTCRFVLVGDDLFGRDGGYRRKVLDQARSSAAADKITFAGWQDDMARIWPAIHCLVHTAEREPFGRVIIEAMSHRIPVIAVDACGPSEIIENDRAGILVPPNDVEALVSAMLRIARDRQEAERMGIAGYNHVLLRFTRVRMARELVDVYAEILTG